VGALRVMHSPGDAGGFGPRERRPNGRAYC
jgi:hypothetical protein